MLKFHIHNVYFQNKHTLDHSRFDKQKIKSKVLKPTDRVGSLFSLSLFLYLSLLLSAKIYSLSLSLLNENISELAAHPEVDDAERVEEDPNG